MNRVLWIMIICAAPAPAHAARLSLALGAGPSLPPDMFRLDILWIMNPTDRSTHHLTGFSLRFNVDYPVTSTGELIVDSIETLPGWDSEASLGIGGTFSEAFFFGADDLSNQGVAGNGTEFTTVIGSVLLRAEGEISGTEVTLRHQNWSDPLPAAYASAGDWAIRWQQEVIAGRQFDIGTGNPGDAGPQWDPYHGFENYSPIVIQPEPSSLALLALGVIALRRLRGPMIG